MDKAIDNKALNRILDKARKSISSYCNEECKAYCCRKGYLILNNDEMNPVTQGRRSELEQKEVLAKVNEEKYSLFLGKYDVPCPSLKNCKCLIHTSKKRPQACRDFPIFIINKYVRLSPRCLAVKSGLFYPLVHQLLKLGYKVSDSNMGLDMEFSELNVPAKKD